MDVTGKTPIFVEKDPFSILQEIAKRLGELVEVHTSVCNELSLANDMKRVEMVRDSATQGVKSKDDLDEFDGYLEKVFLLYRRVEHGKESTDG